MTSEPTRTGGRPSEDLMSVLRLVCSAVPVEQVMVRLGTVRPPARPGDPPRIEPTSYSSLRAIDFLAWTDEDFGLVELQLADPDDWPIAELEAVLGPFNLIVLPDSGARSLVANFEDPSLPAWAAVYLNLDPSSSTGAERVESITIRTEPPEPEDD